VPGATTLHQPGPSALTRKQGFDEFMNLVLDDAVEVKQITKTNDKETRRPLGAYKTDPSAGEETCQFCFSLLTGV
jgi:hypothetical protein